MVPTQFSVMLTMSDGTVICANNKTDIVFIREQMEHGIHMEL